MDLNLHFINYIFYHEFVGTKRSEIKDGIPYLKQGKTDG